MPPTRALRAAAALVAVAAVGACSGAATEDATRSTSSSAGSSSSTATASTPARPRLGLAPDPACRATARAMTPQERSGQLVMPAIYPGGPADALVTEHHVGGVFLLGGWVGAENVKATSSRLQDLASPRSGGSPGLLVAADQEGGQVQQLTGAGFSTVPPATTQARMTPAALRSASAGWGREMAAAGVNVDLAPAVDTVPKGTEAANAPIGALQRHYGATPAAVARSGDEVVRGLRSARVEATVKHFPGIGRITGNTDATTIGTTDTTMRRDDPHLRPFVSGVRSGAGIVMVGSGMYPRIDRHERAVFSHRVIAGVLRKDLGYTGVVATDDVGVAKAVAATPPGQRAARHVAAGGDITLTADASLVGPMTDGITARAAKDERFATRVLDSTTRVLTLKQRMGLVTCGRAGASPTTS